MPPIILKNCRFLFPSAEPSGVRTGLSLRIDGTKITAIDTYERLCAAAPEEIGRGEVVDCSRKIVMPGLVDAHNHLCNTHMNLARVFTIDYNNITNHMLSTVHDPYGWLTEESLYDISTASLVNDIQHGATTVENSTIMPDIAYRAMRDSGVRGILAAQIATSFRLASDDLSWKQMLTRTEENIRGYHDPAKGKMSVVVHIHDFWDTLEAVMLQAMELAQRYDTKYVSHFWEFRDAADRSDALWACDGGAFEHYRRLGLINDRCVFFHGSMLDAATIDRLAETGASIIHNPDINGTNCGNCAYIPYMLEKGVNVGLGSDYGSLDVLTAMKLMLFAHNIMPRDHKGVAYNAPFHAATMGGAQAYGLDHMIGSLEPGKRADIISFDLEGATELLPMCTSALDFDPQILFFLFTRNCAGLKTSETLIDGQFIRRNGSFTRLDEAAIAAKAGRWMERFLPDLQDTLRRGRHYFRVVHDNYVRDEDVPPELLS